MQDNDTSDADGERRREPWQVVGCSTCNVPAGIRCVGSRGVSTHSARKRVFFQRLEEERAERDKLRSAEPPSKGRRNRGSRKDRKSRERSPSTSSPAFSADFEPGDVDRPAPVPTPEWASLAARLRAEHKMSDLPQSKATIPPWEDDPAPVASEPTPAVPVKSPPSPAAEPTGPTRFVFERKVENPDVWNKLACPQCRAPAGTRCFVGLLGETRFASHPQRVAALNEMNTSGD